MNAFFVRNIVFLSGFEGAVSSESFGFQPRFKYFELVLNSLKHIPHLNRMCFYILHRRQDEDT